MARVPPFLLGHVRLLLLSAAVLGIAALALVVSHWSTGRVSPFSAPRPSSPDEQAVAWIKQNVAQQSVIVSDDSVWADLHNQGLDGPAFPFVESHWIVASDPPAQQDVFQGPWQSIDYILMTPGEDQSTFVPSDDTVALNALQNAHLVKEWGADGSGLQLWKVDKSGPTEAKLLSDADASISDRFEQNGAFVDSTGTVTSEAEAYAMLRAVWMNDRPLFDRTWTWSSTNLTQSNGLLAWQWQSGAVTDQHSASDADTDAALALLLAGQEWHAPTLVSAGQTMVQAIWSQDVAQVNGMPYLTAGNWAPSTGTVIALDPSYFAPYAYHDFEGADPGHNWQAVIDSSYQVLFNASSATLGASQSDGLPPDWIGLTPSTTLTPIDLGKGQTTTYGYDAARSYWRVALDAQWSGDGRATAFLQQAGFLNDQMNTNGYVSAVYAHDGTPVEVNPSTVGDAGAVAAFGLINPGSASALYDGQILGGATRTTSGQVYWGSPTDLYSQEWAWFATALYANALPNLWNAGTP